MKSAKGQIASLDIIVSVVIILLLVAAAIMIITKVSIIKEPKAIYGGLIFTNIEQIDDPNIAFLQDYRVDDAKLDNFAQLSDSEIRTILYEGTGFSTRHDVCIFFLNQTSIVQFGLNDVRATGGLGCTTNSPCPNKDQSFVFVKPVHRIIDIVNMYVVVCE